MSRLRALAAILACLAILGCRATARSRADGEAEIAADQSQEIISDYYVAHGELPPADWLTKHVRDAPPSGISVDPRWAFSCEEDVGSSSTMFVKVKVSGPDIRTSTVVYKMDEWTWAEAKRRFPHRR